MGLARAVRAIRGYSLHDHQALLQRRGLNAALLFFIKARIQLPFRRSL